MYIPTCVNSNRSRVIDQLLTITTTLCTLTFPYCLNYSNLYTTWQNVNGNTMRIPDQLYHHNCTVQLTYLLSIAWNTRVCSMFGLVVSTWTTLRITDKSFIISSTVRALMLIAYCLKCRNVCRVIIPWVLSISHLHSDMSHWLTINSSKSY